MYDFTVTVESTKSPACFTFGYYSNLTDAIAAARRIDDEELVDVCYRGKSLLQFTMGDFYCITQPE